MYYVNFHIFQRFCIKFFFFHVFIMKHYDSQVKNLKCALSNRKFVYTISLRNFDITT